MKTVLEQPGHLYFCTAYKHTDMYIMGSNVYKRITNTKICNWWKQNHS